MEPSRTLFAKTYMTIAVTLLLFLLLSAFTVVYFILMPVSTRAADDFASLLVISTKTWVELPPETRPDFKRELANTYELIISSERETWDTPSRFMPYVHLLEAALLERTGKHIPVLVSQRAGEPWFSVDMSVAGQTLRFSFPHARVGARPPVALFYVLVLAIVLILVSSIYLARRITVPITRLSDAIGSVGRGGQPLKLPETGPREIQTLTRHFNKMSTEISTLLAGRSTLFAGISHDLRTPITRMHLALELLSKEADSALIARLRQDLEEMTQLINDTMDLSRGLSPHAHETIDIRDFIAAQIESLPMQGSTVEFESSGSSRFNVDTLALRRVFINLVENARRYGGGAPVEVLCEHSGSEVSIKVLDRGEGIPPAECEAVFQPFYRLEQSRNRTTGGSGLGLAIVKHLCDSNGWKIQLMPRDGGGTSAELVLPKSD